MSDFQTGAALLQAISDLKVVKEIRAAVRANTLKKGGYEGPLGNIDNPKPVHGSWGVLMEPRYEQRQVIHPQARYEERVVHFRTVERPAMADLKQTPNCPLPPEQSAPPLRMKSPLAPPWELPLPIAQPRPIQVVKYETAKPDVICKGMLIDLFI